MEHAALIYTMVIMSAADSDMTDKELFTIDDIIQMIPAFEDFDPELLPRTAEDCAGLLGEANGLDTVIGFIDQNLPDNLRETAYVLACEIAASDGHLQPEELRLLEMLRLVSKSEGCLPPPSNAVSAHATSGSKGRSWHGIICSLPMALEDL